MLANNNIEIIKSFSNIYDDFLSMYTETHSDNDALVSKISHEIKNPLTLVRSMLQLTGSQYPEIRNSCYWNSIFYELDFINDILNNLSSFTTSSTITRSLLRPSQLLQEVCTSYLCLASEHEIHFTSRISKNLNVIMGDEVKLKRAIGNVIKNAIEATQRNGSVCVYARNYKGNVSIVITDSGIGIEPDKIDSIFEPFTTYKTSGTGLGLSIVKNIIKEHGGAIRVTSDPGKGTSVKLIIPKHSL